nr:hypothetical protein [Candidatus Sigynarchaeota archaeon]
MIMEQNEELLRNIKVSLPALEQLLEKITGHWYYEDMVYRFYHQSFKVYRIQDTTREIVDALTKLTPEGATMNEWFREIMAQGASGIQFDLSHNLEWTSHTRPMLEAFFHAKFFLEMAVKYGKELEHAPNMLPSGWATLLYLYNIR